MSPSKVDGFGDCTLRWLLSACGGDGPEPWAPANIGTLVHDIAAELGDVDADDAASPRCERALGPAGAAGRAGCPGGS